jgi:sugar lactone lactonase YvrE
VVLSSKGEVQTLLTGRAFVESPRWHEGRLWFSDWLTREILAVDLRGMSEVMYRVATFPFSLDWLPDGRLLVTSGTKILGGQSDGSLAPHADLGNVCKKGLNEIVVDGRGNVYVNDVGFDLMAGEDFAPGMIALLTADGTVRQVADGIAFPNGMAVTSDDSTLIVAESYGRKLTAFDIERDGSLSNRRVWANLGNGVPDGICIDAENAVWYGDVPNKRCVRVREGGELLQVIDLDRGCFACMLGGENRNTLFMMVAEWYGVSKMSAEGARTGKVLTFKAPVPGGGRP